jgi:hypothetical protein
MSNTLRAITKVAETDSLVAIPAVYYRDPQEGTS